jgi:hypothetical protein
MSDFGCATLYFGTIRDNRLSSHHPNCPRFQLSNDAESNLTSYIQTIRLI